MSNSHIRQWVGFVLLILSCLIALIQPAPRQSQAQTGPAATDANGWSFVDMARVGQDGFTSLSSGRAGSAGVVVVQGVRNGREGIFHVEDGVVTEVATDGAVLPNGLGTLSSVGIFSFQYAVLPNGDVLFNAFAKDGSLNPDFRYSFRWNNGTITIVEPSQATDPQTLTQAFEHVLTQVTTDDRWLATLRSGAFPNVTIDYGLTNGASRSSIFGFANSGANCVFNNAPLAGPMPTA